MARATTIFAFAALLTAAAAAQTPPAQPVEPGFVYGVATDAAGQPLAGIQIFIDGIGDNNVFVTTKEDGSYRARVSFGAYRAYATMERVWEGQTFKIDLKPDVTDSFDAADGGVRNFTWTLTGRKQPPDMGEYGAFIYVNLGTDFTYIEDQENITYTLTPVGALIDGSTIPPIVRKGGAERTPEYGKILDLPVGRYVITGVYAPPGMKPQTLRFKDAWTRGGDFAESLEFVIRAEGNYCSVCASLDVESLKAPEPL
ncbi:MAG: hypothetical protein U1F24_15420 [Alphaproteobacteria bacterium]|jgi:hypothetical protein